MSQKTSPKNTRVTFTLSIAFSLLSFSLAEAKIPAKNHFSNSPHVQIQNNQLFVDGVAQPQLFGAELQYFRLRGGTGRNIPRERVIALWNRALDRMVEAKMNTISFYIPWDFHEYAEGKFDFTGTVDEDGDGNPDYPSRDIFTFFRLIEEHGIKKIMVRPGPYINAEWGFLGFGAIPLWFHEKYPDSHMRNADGLRTKLYSYYSEDLLRHTQLWFKELYTQVLNKYMGAGKPIIFVQIDNETNYMWQSIYNHDYGPVAMEAYRHFLKDRYSSLDALNRAYQNTLHAWDSWETIQAPRTPGLNTTADQDWYRFQDISIHDYLHEIRQIWERLGVTEPNVYFTLAESYNAMDHGMLPHYTYRNDPGKTGLMTVNLYPKTYESPLHSLLNNPFKADHDVKAAESASDHYLGHTEEWVFGPEIQGGWWKGIPVSQEARKQTYLTTLGHGLKGMMVYYFSEGNNWQADWAKKQVEPYFNTLRASPEFSAYANQPDSSLPNEFWSKLQKTIHEKIIVGIDARFVWFQDQEEIANLFFDAPLNGDAEPGPQYQILKEIGEKLIAPHQDFLAKAVAVHDPVAILQDSDLHVPSPLASEGLDSVKFNADWMAGLVGYVLQTGFNPQILHRHLTPEAEIWKNSVILYPDSGIRESASETAFHTQIKKYVSEGGVWVNFIGDATAQGLGLAGGKTLLPSEAPLSGENLQYRYFNQEKEKTFSTPRSLVFRYPAISKECEAVLYLSETPVGYRCKIGKGFFYQIGALLYGDFNTDRYAWMNEAASLRHFLDTILQEGKAKGASLTPSI